MTGLNSRMVGLVLAGLAVLAVSGAPGTVVAQASGSGAPMNIAMAWPPKPEKDGYLPGAAGYVRFPYGPEGEASVTGCADRGSRITATNVGFGPVDAAGWVRYADLLQCGTGKRLKRIEAPNLHLSPFSDVNSYMASRGAAMRAFYTPTVGGSLLRLRDGRVIWLDERLKEVPYDPDTTVFSQRENIHLLGEPGLFVPYLKDGSRYQLPQGMKGFMAVKPEAGAFSSPPEHFRTRVEVWDGPMGRRYGACGRSRDEVSAWEAQPPPCGPLYKTVDVQLLTWDTPMARQRVSHVVLGEREDGLWEVAHMNADPIVQPANYQFSQQATGALATAAEQQRLAPAPRAALMTALSEVFSERMRAAESHTASFYAIQKNQKEAEAFWAGEMARQRREAVLAEAERRRKDAETRRAAQEAAVAAALASGDARCWNTPECGLSARQRYALALKAGARADAHRIALGAVGTDRTVTIDDIQADWAAAGPGRGLSFWYEEKVHALGLRDPLVRQGVGPQIWQAAERWAAARDAFALERNAQSFWAGLANLGPITLPSAQSGARPLSALEQDYYVGRGYVVVTRRRPGA